MKKIIAIAILSILMPTIAYAGFWDDLKQFWGDIFSPVEKQIEQPIQQLGATICQSYQGCTGTSTNPHLGDIMIGGFGNQWARIASSSAYNLLTVSSTAPYGIGWSSQIGASTNRLDAFLDDLDATTLTIGGTASGDLNMGNKDILNANLVKANYFNATSTTATSTFSGGFTAGNNAALVVNQAATANSLYINPSGNVGIGTAGPEAPLHVANGSAGTVTVDSNAKLVIEGSAASFLQFQTPNNVNAGIVFGDPQSVNIGLIRYLHASDAMDFYVNGGTRVYINSSGNVGIGNTAPSSKLTVNGGDLAVSSTGAATTTISSGVSTIAGGMIVNASSTINHNLTVGTSTALFVDSGNGRVGIGTASPKEMLHLWEGSSGGTADGASLMVIEDNTNAYLTFLTPSANKAGILWGDEGSGVIGQIIYNHSDNHMEFTTSATEQMRITSAGNVGIGTTTPSSILTVSDTATSTISVYSSSATLGGCVEIEGADGTWAHFITNNSVISSIAGRCE